ncbi:MAG: hypothetical protein PHP03_00710 [Candidatus Pacebacteria bacterium]|nr:hypothetical protein [Candidatus Paceibacterota bacterium]
MFWNRRNGKNGKKKKRSLLRLCLEWLVVLVILYKLGGVVIAWIWTHKAAFAIGVLGAEIAAYLAMKNWIGRLYFKYKFRIFRKLKKTGNKIRRKF